MAQGAGEGEAEPRLPLRDLPQIRTRKGAIAPRSPAQAAYMLSLIHISEPTRPY